MVKLTPSPLLMLLALGSLFLAPACSSSNEAPEVATFSEAAFGCYINGAVYVPNAEDGFDPVAVSVEENQGLLNLRIATHRKNVTDRIYFVVSAQLPLGMLCSEAQPCLAEGVAFHGQYTRMPDLGNNREYYRTKPPFKEGQLMLTHYDPVQRTVVGTFSFDGRNPEGGTVEVRDGHFNLSF